jgi:ubiquitin C-terminal hydrolase
MPKVKTNTYSRLQSCVSEFGSSVFLIDESVLFCKLCEVKVSAQKSFTVLQHLKTEKHIKSVNRIDKPIKSQQLLEFNLPTKKYF